jgi:hypothetical protein
VRPGMGRCYGPEHLDHIIHEKITITQASAGCVSVISSEGGGTEGSGADENHARQEAGGGATQCCCMFVPEAGGGGTQCCCTPAYEMAAPLCCVMQSAYAWPNKQTNKPRLGSFHLGVVCLIAVTLLQ